MPYVVGEPYYVNVASQILFYAIFALGLNVLVGYAGLVSLGHAGLFGVASYVVASALAAGYGHAVAITRRARRSVSSAPRAVFAALSLRATGISFIMITLALGEILWGLAYRWISLTNGDNGISVASRPTPFGIALGSAQRVLRHDARYFPRRGSARRRYSCARRSARALCGTRDQPRRMNALGYHVWMIRFWRLHVLRPADPRRRHPVRLLQQVHQPADAGATASAEALLMVISGGAGTLARTHRRRRHSSSS